MSKKQILLVEDNHIDCKAVGRALKDCYSAAELEIRTDGLSAMELLEAGNYHPDLILLDIKLPKLSGHDILKWLRKRTKTKKVPVVMLTSSDEPRDISSSYALGANSFVQKPDNFDVFAKRICQVAKYWLDVNLA